ncbi:MAG: hypothetical protein MK207_14120 [Saprospiraceae bacterium]|nr:hypothetical protein [Saprospiraceae bacterium]
MKITHLLITLLFYTPYIRSQTNYTLTGGSGSGASYNIYTTSIIGGLYQGDSLSGYDMQNYSYSNGRIYMYQGDSLSGYSNNNVSSCNSLNESVYTASSAGGQGYDSRSYGQDHAAGCYTMGRPEFVSIIDGNWNNINTWDCGCIPDSTGNITIRHNVDANHNFNLLEDRTLNIDVSGNLAISALVNIDGNLNNNGEITGDLNITGTSSRLMNIGVVENLFMLTSGTISVNGDSYIRRLLKLSNGTIAANGNNVVLQASSIGTCLVHDDGGLTSGDFTVEQYIPDAGNPYANIYYASPVNNATIGQINDDCNMLLTGNANSFYYDETSGQWVTPGSLAHPMANGEGFYQYAYVGSGSGYDNIFDFTGELNTGNITTPISNTGNGGGWNIIGNPYPSPINLTDLWGVNTNPAVYYRYNGSSYNSFIAPIGLSNPPGLTANVPIMQGFWVNAGTFNTISFDNSIRITDPADTVDNFTKHTLPLFRLAMEHQSERITSVVYFFNEATDDIDENYDALYLDGDNSFQFATKTGNTNMSINGLPELVGLTDTIPLYTEITTLGNYTISLTEISNFPSGSKIMLQDLLLSVSHDLTKGDYSYIGNPVEGNDRFIITLLSTLVNTDKIEDETKFEAYRCFDNLCVSFSKVLEKNTAINIYNVLGQTIFSSTLQKGKQFCNIEKANLSGTNVYFIDIEGYEKTTKIVWE